MGQLVALRFRGDIEREAVVAHALRLADVTFSAQFMRDALVGRSDPSATMARVALRAMDPLLLRAAAERLGRDVRGRWAAANADRTAALIERYAADVGLACGDRASRKRWMMATNHPDTWHTTA